MDHLQSMRVFVKVADLGSFAKAATHFDISNAVVTRYVADLEGKLGTRLLNRTTRSLSLTESGQVYLERVRQIIDELEDVEQMVVERTHEPMGTLRIAAPVAFGLHNLAPALASYQTLYPRVLPDLTLVDHPVDLVEEGYDVGLMVSRHMRSASIVTRRLATGCMVVCASPAYLDANEPISQPEQLLNHPFLGLPPEYASDDFVFSGPGPGEEVRVRPNSVLVANNTDMLRQFVLQGVGVSILPSYLVGRDILLGNLVALMPEYRLPLFDVNIAYPSRRHLPAKVRTFIDHLVDHFSGAAGETLHGHWLSDGERANERERAPEPAETADAPPAPHAHGARPAFALPTTNDMRPAPGMHRAKAAPQAA